MSSADPAARRFLAVVTSGPEGRLGWCWQTPNPDVRWTDWVALGPSLQSAPTVCHNADGRLEVFAAGPDGRLGHVFEEHGHGIGWSDWAPFSFAIRDAPSAFQNADGRLEVFVVGPKGSLGHLWQLEPGGVSGWSDREDFGVQIRDTPVVYQNTDGRLEVFASTLNGSLGHSSQLEPGGASGWSDWDDLGVEIRDTPAVFHNVDGRLEVFAAGPEGSLGHSSQLEPGGASGWSEWVDFGFRIRNSPAVSMSADGHLDVFALSLNGHLGHLWQLKSNGTGGWSGWSDFGLPIRDSPTVYQNDDGRLEVFASSLNGTLGHLWQLKPSGVTGWSAWADFGHPVAGRRVAVSQTITPGRIDLTVLQQVQERSKASWPAHSPSAFGVDVCVIGAGPAGITVSEGLVNAGATVLLVDSGGWNEEFMAQELNHGDADGPIIKGYLKYLRYGRRRGVQGSASVWGPGWLLPFRAIDFEPRPWVAHSGWPLTPGELAPFEQLAAATFGFEVFSPPVSEGSLVRLSYHFPPNPQLFRSTFVSLLTKPGFQAELGTTAVELAMSGDRVEHVRLARAAGGELRVSADVVVLAAGGIENARQLLLHANTLPAAATMAGRGFTEHPHVRVGTASFPELAPLTSFLERKSSLEVFALSDEMQRHEQLLNANVQLRLLGHSGPYEGPGTCELYLRTEQVPNFDSRVTLAERLDPFGKPQPYLQWLTQNQDWQSVVRSAELLSFGLEEQYGAEVELSIRADGPWPWSPASPHDSPNATWGNHHMGTTRMADQPADGSVDRNCRAHGTTNLFVAGSSVFPTGGAANPTFTIVALAHRLVHHLSTLK
jgi:peptide methionine sulfoxide reductase MsrB